ncbi:putative reverse transcriptase domain-containing protein [Tanacetum coccineum]
MPIIPHICAIHGSRLLLSWQLQTILPQIVTQVTNNVNNANGGNGGNGGNNGCTYKGFLAYNPKEYDGKGGAIALTRWIEKMENVIDNSGCAENQKVKYSASSFVNKALTWWNTQIQARGREAANGMSWTNFKTLLIEEFCPSNEMEKLETEFWNHKMVGANHAGYTDRFHELAKLVPHLVTPESSRIKRYVAGLVPEIRGMLKATQPTTIQDAILRAGILTDEAVSCGTLTKGNEKRKSVEETSKSGGSWRDNKKAKVGTGFVATAPPRNESMGPYSRCAKCYTFHLENGPCKVCYNCQKLGHFVKDCRAPFKQVVLVNAVKMGYKQKVCYECGSSEHLRNTCPKMNRAPGQAGNPLALEGNRNAQNNGNRATGRPFNVNVNAVEALQDPNVVTKVADGKKVEVNRIICDCKLELGNSLFSINLIPLGHGSFDVIVGMDWLSQNKAMIVCHEKVFEIPLEDGGILRVQGEHTLGIVKALMNAKVDEPKLSDISVVRDFVDVFLEDLSGLPPHRQVEFRIDSVPGATPVAKSPYRLAPSEMQELSRQLQELQDKGFIRPSHSPWGAPVLFVKKRDGSFRGNEIHLRLVLEFVEEREVVTLNFQVVRVPIRRNVLAEKCYGLDQQMERKEDGSLYFMDRIWVLLLGGVRMRIMDEAHKTKYSVHPGAEKMYYDLRDMYWPSGLLQQHEIPEWKWDRITMDFITKLPKMKSGHDTIWVIVDRLTTSAHFLPMREDYSTERLAKLYIDEIAARQRIPVSIISDRDGWFTSHC